MWTNPTPVPDDIVTLGLAENLVDDPLAMEAQRASAHFTYDPDATYIIMTPPRPVATGQPVYCGYHSQTTSLNGLGNPYRIEYSFIPWQNTDWPGLGQGCGMHNVNATSNSFGNGIFDSWSVVVGHEYSEAVTDPDNFFGGPGQVDERGPDLGERRQVRVDRDAEHQARKSLLRSTADLEQRGVRRRQGRLRGLALVEASRRAGIVPPSAAQD